MSKEEEELVRELLWKLVNNHVFFQHPDLVRILGIHENVIDIMMNSIARASQEDSSAEETSNEASLYSFIKKGKPKVIMWFPQVFSWCFYWIA